MKVVPAFLGGDIDWSTPGFSGHCQETVWMEFVVSVDTIARQIIVWYSILHCRNPKSNRVYSPVFPSWCDLWKGSSLLGLSKEILKDQWSFLIYFDHHNISAGPVTRLSVSVHFQFNAGSCLWLLYPFGTLPNWWWTRFYFYSDSLFGEGLGHM